MKLAYYLPGSGVEYKWDMGAYAAICERAGVDAAIAGREPS
jgi:hypothetical protein